LSFSTWKRKSSKTLPFTPTLEHLAISLQKAIDEFKGKVPAGKDTRYIA